MPSKGVARFRLLWNRKRVFLWIDSKWSRASSRSCRLRIELSWMCCNSPRMSRRRSCRKLGRSKKLSRTWFTECKRRTKSLRRRGILWRNVMQSMKRRLRGCAWSWIVSVSSSQCHRSWIRITNLKSNHQRKRKQRRWRRWLRIFSRCLDAIGRLSWHRIEISRRRRWLWIAWRNWFWRLARRRWARRRS